MGCNLPTLVQNNCISCHSLRWWLLYLPNPMSLLSVSFPPAFPLKLVPSDYTTHYPSLLPSMDSLNNLASGASPLPSPKAVPAKTLSNLFYENSLSNILASCLLDFLTSCDLVFTPPLAAHVVIPPTLLLAISALCSL